MQKKGKILIVIDQIAPSTGGFWTVLDIAYSLKDKYEIAFYVAGLNFIGSVFSFNSIVKKKISESSIFISPMLKRRSKKLFKIKIFYLLAFYIYKLFISIYFFNHKFQLKKYLKDTKVIFFSSFISIEDFKKISLSLNDDCIKIQNHAGSIKTLENFSNAQNNKTSSDCNPYLDYLNLQDKIIFQSNLQKQEINNKFPFLKDKTFSFLPSVNEGDLLNAKLIDSPFFNKDVFNIVYVATIQERKRQKLCLKIIEKILNKDFDVNLYFVGSYNKHDNYFTDLEKTVCDMKLQNHVFFTGYTENFANYMWHSDLILHPSSAEGVPRVLREASFIGKTIIASDLEGHRDLFEKYDSAILIKSSSPDLYAEAILSIKDDLNLKLSYEKKARISYDNLLRFDIYRKNIISVFNEE